MPLRKNWMMRAAGVLRTARANQPIAAWASAITLAVRASRQVAPAALAAT